MSRTERSYLFTLTAGRTGTAFLASLIAANVPEAECHHEMLGYDRFGVDTPDVSHMTLFNSAGNVAKVRDFWRIKLGKVRRSSAPFYAETSHLLMKAGLVENLDKLNGAASVHLVVLKRDPFDTILSFRNRFDFANKGMWWLWYLDPDYPNKIVDSTRLKTVGINGICLWYLLEISARAEYYRLLLRGRSDVRFHDVRLEELNDPATVSGFLAGLGVARAPRDVAIPTPVNRGKNRIDWSEAEEAAIRRLIEGVRFDPVRVASDFVAAGRRL
jgi:hypothetical protein